MNKSQKEAQQDLERYKQQQRASRPSIPLGSLRFSKKGLLLGKKLFLLLLSPKVLVIAIFTISAVVSFPFVKEQAQKVIDVIKPSKKYKNCLSVWGSRVLKAAERYSVDAALISAIMWQESKCNPEALGARIQNPSSPHFGHSAIGLMQIMPLTAKEVCNIVQVSRLWEPEVNITCGTKIIANLAQDVRCRPKYRGDYFRIAAGYYGGPRACTRASLDSTLNKSTEEYAREVLQHYAIIAEILPATSFAKLRFLLVAQQKW